MYIICEIVLPEKKCLHRTNFNVTDLSARHKQADLLNTMQTDTPHKVKKPPLNTPRHIFCWLDADRWNVEDKKVKCYLETCVCFWFTTRA